MKDYVLIQSNMPLEEKLKILSAAAKYDVSCSSSGVERKGNGKDTGSASAAGICHSFASDGRCISLLKILPFLLYLLLRFYGLEFLIFLL